MGQRVAELAALVDRAGRLRRHVARDAAGEGELAEEPPEPLRVAPDLGIDLRVGALEVGVRHQGRAAVPGAGDVERLEVAPHDRAVHVRVDEAQAGRGAPVAEEPRLDVLDAQGLAQEGVVEQVDLPHRQVVRRAPPGVDAGELLVGERRGGGRGHAPPPRRRVSALGGRRARWPAPRAPAPRACAPRRRAPRRRRRPGRRRCGPDRRRGRGTRAGARPPPAPVAEPSPTPPVKTTASRPPSAAVMAAIPAASRWSCTASASRAARVARHRPPLGLAHVRRSRESRQTALLAEHPPHLLWVHPAVEYQVQGHVRVDGARARRHHQPLEGAEAHRGVHRPASRNGRRRCAPAEMADHEPQVGDRGGRSSARPAPPPTPPRARGSRCGARHGTCATPRVPGRPPPRPAVAAWNAVSKTATCGTPGNRSRAVPIHRRAGDVVQWRHRALALEGRGDPVVDHHRGR